MPSYFAMQEKIRKHEFFLNIPQADGRISVETFVIQVKFNQFQQIPSS